MIYISENQKDTEKLARYLAETLAGNEIILLSGELGAGKTTFVKALAKAIGILETVTSPTFTFMKEYAGKFPLFHFDLYRAETEEEVEELGLKEYFGKGVCAVEWNKFKNLAGKIITVDIAVLPDGTRRIAIEKFPPNFRGEGRVAEGGL